MNLIYLLLILHVYAFNVLPEIYMTHEIIEFDKLNGQPLEAWLLERSITYHRDIINKIDEMNLNPTIKKSTFTSFGFYPDALYKGELLANMAKLNVIIIKKNILDLYVYTQNIPQIYYGTEQRGLTLDEHWLIEKQLIDEVFRTLGLHVKF